MASLLCQRKHVHRASDNLAMHTGPPPRSYHLPLHFINPTTIPVLPAHLVSLPAVVDFRTATAALTANVKWSAKDIALISSLNEKVKAASAELIEKAAKIDIYYNEETGKSEVWVETPEHLKRELNSGKVCTAECCKDGDKVKTLPPEDRVIYRYLGEERPGLLLMEAIHFEIFVPDRLDLRFLIVPPKIAKRANLQECQLFWIRSSMIELLAKPDRQRFEDFSHISYPLRFTLNEAPESVQEDRESWTTSLRVLTQEIEGDIKTHQSVTYYGAIGGQSTEMAYCRESLLTTSGIQHADVRSGTVTRRNAYWLYSVEPIRNYELYAKATAGVVSAKTQNGYRISSVSTEVLEEENCSMMHMQGFDFRDLSPEECFRRMRLSFSMGVTVAEIDYRGYEVTINTSAVLDGYLAKLDPPQLIMRGERKMDTSMIVYANIYLLDHLSKIYTYSLHVVSWEIMDNKYTTGVLTCRPNPYIGQLADQFGCFRRIPCKVRFGPTPFHATHELVRSKFFEEPSRPAVPILSSIYRIPINHQVPIHLSKITAKKHLDESETKRSTRILSTANGRRLADLRPVKFACARPSTSFALLGEQRSEQTETAAAIALAMPTRQKKVLIAHDRASARALFNAYIDLRFSDKEKRTEMKKGQGVITCHYDDYEDLPIESEVCSFFVWPEEDIMILTIDNAIEMLYHDGHKSEAAKFLQVSHTMIIDTAEMISEAQFYILAIYFRPCRYVIVGDPASALAREAQKTILPAAVHPILSRVLKTKCSLRIMQLPPAQNSERVMFHYQVPIDLIYFSGFQNHIINKEMKALEEVLDAMVSVNIDAKDVSILTVDKDHTELVREYWPTELTQYDICEIREFEGKVRPIIVFLGGWYASPYWKDDTINELLDRLHLDIFIRLSFNNYGELRDWSSAGFKRVVVERGLCRKLSSSKRVLELN